MGATSLISRMKNMTSRVVDSFIPIADDEEYEEEQEQREQTAKAETQRTASVEQRRVANGGTVSFSTAAYGATAKKATRSFHLKYPKSAEL